MSIRNLNLQNFRNFSELQIDVPLNGIVLEGNNGSGKTNFLEAIYFLGTGRSHRGSKKTDLIKFGAEFCYAEAEYINTDLSKIKKKIGLGKDKSIVMKINDTTLSSVIEWFSNNPIVSFGPNDLSLVYGTPEDRRKFLDILCSQLHEQYIQTLILYKKALLNRNKLLIGNFDKNQILIYENQMSESGAYLFFKRNETIQLLLPYFIENYSQICGDNEKVNLQYISSFKHECSSKFEWKNVFSKSLEERRYKDCECRYTSIGPHRDDIAIFLNERLSKNYCSQGQCRSLVLAIKLASVFCLEKSHKERMIFLVDDAVSELDPERTSRVLPLLENKGQIFVAVPELKKNLLRNLIHLRVEKGIVSVT